MKADWSALDKYRIKEGEFATPPGAHYGQFVLPVDSEATLFAVVIATDGTGGDLEPEYAEAGLWEHVSLHIRYRTLRGANDKPLTRTPTWDEMCAVKQRFWNDEEAVIQIHPPRSQYINTHPHVLHLWRPTHKEVPLPPQICV